MTKLPAPKLADALDLILRAEKRYEACLKVYGARSSHTRAAKKARDTYVAKAKARGQI